MGIFMKKKILPLGTPLAKCFLYDADPLSILSVKDYYLPWFYCNYIHMCLNPNYFFPDSVHLYNYRPGLSYQFRAKRPNHDFLKTYGLCLEFFPYYQALSNPFLDYEFLSWEIFNKMGIDIVPYVIKHIQCEYYFFGYVDEYYINDRVCYHKYHNPHDLFIYGYDDQKQIFYTMGYNSSGFYSSQEVSYADFSKAFAHNKQNKYLFYWTDKIHFLHRNDDSIYEMDSDFIFASLKSYMLGENVSDCHKASCNSIPKIYDFDIYDKLIEYMPLSKTCYKDLRIPNLLYEHKKIMRMRFEYMLNNVELPGEVKTQLTEAINQYAQMEKITLKIQSLMIKNDLTKGSENITDKLIPYYKNLKEAEYESLNSLLDKVFKDY
jgi:hypothetical protein